MKETATAFPLAWPEGWRRTPKAERVHDRFGSRSRGSYGTAELSVAGAVDRVFAELYRLGARDADIVISTNIRPTLAGVPRSNQREPEDSGAAVYWRQNGARQCMAVDRYRSVAGNLAAIAATLDAMRAIERHGGAEILDRAFTGFVALPSPEQPFQVLGVPASATADQVRDAYRQLAAKHHPDRAGGDAAAMARINAARDAMMARFG
jgi:hypothetical protein